VARPKTNLSESRLARSLVERGLVLGDMIEQIFQTCSASGGLLTEALVQEGLMTDWELSRIACEVFNLPFMPVEVHAPTERALEGLDPEFLKRWCLVPLVRNGDLLTIAIPAAISPQTFDELAAMSGGELAIVVGSVLTNRQWLRENLS
jgi:hypothetical protein